MVDISEGVKIRAEIDQRGFQLVQWYNGASIAVYLLAFQFLFENGFKEELRIVSLSIAFSVFSLWVQMFGSYLRRGTSLRYEHVWRANDDGSAGTQADDLRKRVRMWSRASWAVHFISVTFAIFSTAIAVVLMFCVSISAKTVGVTS